MKYFGKTRTTPIAVIAMVGAVASLGVVAVSFTAQPTYAQLANIPGSDFEPPGLADALANIPGSDFEPPGLADALANIPG
jgi:hypothetical protein